MKSALLFSMLAMMLLSSTASALSQNSTAILEFASFAVPHGAQFSIQPFNLSSSQGYAVVSGNEVYGIFVSGMPFLENRPITAPDEIENALTAYYVSQGYSPNISFSDVHSGLMSIMPNHEKGEAKCRILTGTDRTACTDFESCQKACYSVTSFCLSIALGSGRTFVNEIWKFENGSLALDSAYLNESTAYSTLLDGITHEEARAYLDTLIGVNRAATSASKSALYDGYSYCFEPDYALPVITNMQLTAQKRYSQSEPFFTLVDKAKLVRSRTLAALEFASADEQDKIAAQAARDAALAEKNASENASAQNASAPAPQPPAPAQDATPLLLAGALLLAFMAGGAYLFMRHRKKKT
jgi:hypothetical protein